MARMSSSNGTDGTDGTDGTAPKWGRGSVDLRPSGRWRVRVRRPDGSRVTETCATEGEARALLAALIVERHKMVAAGEVDLEPAALTLDGWGTRWLNTRDRENATRYPTAERARWARYIGAHPLGAMELTRVRSRDVARWVSWLRTSTSKRGKGFAAQTIRNAFSLLHKALADAVSAEELDANPAEGVTLQLRGGPTGERAFLSGDEVSRLLECEAIPAPTRDLYAVAIYTGLRQGELWALRWEDVALDGDRPAVTVRRSHQHAPKNGKSRVVPLFDAAREALQRTLARARSTAPGDLVFPAPRGSQRQYGDDAGWSSRKVRDRHRVGHRDVAGLNPAVTFHGLRHTCASHLVMGTFTGETWPLADVSRFLGHSGVGVTERYAHTTAEHLHRRVASVSKRGTAGPILRPAGPILRPAAPENGSRANHGNACFSVPPTRLERVAYGLGNRCSMLVSPMVREVQDTFGTHSPPEAHPAEHLRALALEMLSAVDRGAPAGDLARSLAVEVLRGVPPTGEAWALALSVVEGGPLKMRRAVELAGWVVEGGTVCVSDPCNARQGERV